MRFHSENTVLKFLRCCIDRALNNVSAGRPRVRGKVRERLKSQLRMTVKKHVYVSRKFVPDVSGGHFTLSVNFEYSLSFPCCFSVKKHTLSSNNLKYMSSLFM